MAAGQTAVRMIGLPQHVPRLCSLQGKQSHPKTRTKVVHKNESQGCHKIRKSDSKKATQPPIT